MNLILNNAKRSRMDEFYTRPDDVVAELSRYDPPQFYDKAVLLNCDGPESAFWGYFNERFTELGLRRLVATRYSPDGGHIVERIGGRTVESRLSGNGDFRSDEAVALMHESDIVVTNPPFSLLRSHIGQTLGAGKGAIILGSINAITYQEVFPYIQSGRLRLGASHFNTGMFFYVPDDFKHVEEYGFPTEMDGRRVSRVPAICWFTTLKHDNRAATLPLTATFSPETYPRFDAFDAIEVGRVADIPCDYFGVMAVPVTFLNKHNPTQFDIVGCTYEYGRPTFWPADTKMQPILNGRHIYKRLLIRRRTDTVGA